jgi:thymidine phosphorylase
MAVMLGAGRKVKGEAIDLSVGIMVEVKVGDRVENGQPLFVIHAREAAEMEAAKEKLLGAVKFSSDPVSPLPLFYGMVD